MQYLSGMSTQLMARVFHQNHGMPMKRLENTFFDVWPGIRRLINTNLLFNGAFCCELRGR